LDVQLDDIWKNRFAGDHVWFCRTVRSKIQGALEYQTLSVLSRIQTGINELDAGESPRKAK
jgi:hypothetical protein